MSIMNNLAEMARSKILNFLHINPAPDISITLNEVYNKATSNIKNRIWYNGEPEQLEQFYRTVNGDKTSFWSAKCTAGLEIRKIHIGLPALIVDTLVNIVVTDYNGIEIQSESSTLYSERWDVIEKENKFSELLETVLTDLGVVGDGAFKISYDADISDMPIIEWYPSERVDFIEKRGRIREVQFHTEVVENNKQYCFTECYGYGYIKYKLYNADGKEIPLHSIEYTSWIDCEGIQFDKSCMWAVPVRFGESCFKGRGKGLLEGKDGNFDSVDEAWSQWMDALRAGRTKQYVPKCFLPVNPKTGEYKKPNAFDDRFFAVETPQTESGQGVKIYTETPQIQHESYLSTYTTALDLCLQGLISPSTLGIDMKKLDNADAQREKEKATLYTRQKFIELLSNVLPQLVSSVLDADAQLHNRAVVSKDFTVAVNFGEYANPSFESQVETVGKARQAGAMSVEQGVEELYGDSKDKAWKELESQRIKNELGIVSLPETSEQDDITIDVTDNNASSQLLNGAQITSLMSIITMIKSGQITRNEGLSIMTSTLGVSRENADKFVEEQL